MKKIAILLFTFYSLLSVSGCTLSDQAFDIISNISTEAVDGYNNVKEEVETKTESVQEKIDKFNQAAEDIGSAATAVGQAIDSVQDINEEEEETEEPTTE